jgi:hypothetical protein
MVPGFKRSNMAIAISANGEKNAKIAVLPHELVNMLQSLVSVRINFTARQPRKIISCEMHPVDVTEARFTEGLSFSSMSSFLFGLEQFDGVP